MTSPQTTRFPSAVSAASANAAADAATYLGPAEVTGGTRLRPEVELDDGRRVPITLALAFPHEPTTGDVLLVLGQPAGPSTSAETAIDFYAVGVIKASRPAQLRFPGDTSIHATGGRLTLSSDRAVEVNAPRVTVRAGVLRTIAESIVEKSDRMRRWVRDLLAVRAGSSRRTIDGEDSTRCENSTTLAQDTVKIDGDQLHLGH